MKNVAKDLNSTCPSVLRLSLLFLYSSLALLGLELGLGLKLEDNSVLTEKSPSGRRLSIALRHLGRLRSNCLDITILRNFLLIITEPFIWKIVNNGTYKMLQKKYVAKDT